MTQPFCLLLGFSREFIGELRCNRQSITFTLVRLDHKQYPKNQTDYRNQPGKHNPERKSRPYSRQATRHEHHANYYAKNHQCPEDYNRLGGVKANEGAFIRQEKD